MADDNIEIGEGDLLLKFAQDPDPVNIGACEGAEFSRVPEFLKVFEGRKLHPIKIFKIKEEVSFKILMKATGAMRNLAIAMGVDPYDIESDSEAETFTIYSNTVDSVPTCELEYRVRRVKDKTKYWIYSGKMAAVMSEFKLAFKKDAERIYEVTFSMLPDETDDNAVMTVSKELTEEEAVEE